MKKAAVLGVGRMGQAIAYAMKKLGFFVVGVDSDERAAQSFRKYIDSDWGTFYLTGQNNADKSIERALSFEKPDIVISSLPYHQTEEAAYWCIDNEFRYCDLGGRVDVSKNINDYAKEKAIKPVFTDLGLAPGWVNIMAEEGFRQLGEAENIKMMVGGLPAKKYNPPFNYTVTWSVDGLINEYMDDCEVLKGGEVCKVEGMSGLETVNIKHIGELEAFYTSGGASHTIRSMKERGVKNCSYKTLRFPGHRDAMRFLLKDCDLDRGCIEQILEKGCSDNEHGDVVIIMSVVQAWPLEWKDWVIVSRDEPHENDFSAMQKATAFSISGIASIMGEGQLDKDSKHRRVERRGYYDYPSSVLTYKDISKHFYDEFTGRLYVLGLRKDGEE